MGDKELGSITKEIKNIRIRLQYFQRMISLTPCISMKNSYNKLMNMEFEKLSLLLNNFEVNPNSLEENMDRQGISLTLEELPKYNGLEGKPAYVAVEGIVYEVSDSPGWGGASHFGLLAGKDLSSEFKKCHPSGNVLMKLKRVGVLK